MVYDNPELAAAVFRKVGELIYRYFCRCLEYDEVGAVLCNDDWGFSTQTMLAPDLLRIHVFPWYKKIVEKAHALGKYAILHSCGYYYDIIDDVIEVMGFDGRQSYKSWASTAASPMRTRSCPSKKPIGNSIPGLPSWEELTSIFL